MTRGRGRPRARKALCPPHIDTSKLPDYCYWDPKGEGHWYTKKIGENGKQRRSKIAGPKATLADLHRAMEQAKGNPVDCFDWLADLFEKSPQFRDVSKAQQKDWRYCRRVVSDYPTKKQGVMLGKVPLGDWKTAMVQKLVDGVGETRGPTAAKHVNSYLKRLFNWGRNRGYCQENPVGRTELPEERKRRRLPDPAVVARLVAFAQERGSLPDRSAGSCPHYVWTSLEIAYLCRLRGIEVFRMADDQLLEEGVLCKRTKGSRGNVTRWNARLRRAVDAALEARRAIWTRRGHPIPLKAEKRLLQVNTAGEAIKPFAWQNTWKRFLALAIKEGVITEDETFGLHDMKRRGATDTKGTKGEKLDATGHSSVAMLNVYDMSLPIVDAAGE